MTIADLFADDKSEWPEDKNDVSHAMVFKLTRRQPNLKPAEIFRQICQTTQKSFSHPQQSFRHFTYIKDDWLHMNSLLYICFMSSLSENQSRSPLDLLPLCRLRSVLSKLSARNNK